MENLSFEIISELILKKIEGRITPEEEEVLQNWIDSSPKNSQLYSKLSNTSYLHGQYQKWRVIKSNSHESRQAMLVRISRDKSNFREMAKNVAAVAVVVLVGVLSYCLYFRSE